MTRLTDWLPLLHQERAIVVLRPPDVATGIAMAEAMAAGGLNLLEVTWGWEEPTILLRELRDRLPHCTIGAGTITTHTQFDQAQTAGAEFLFSPVTDAALIHRAIAADLPIVPGALTPSEIFTAWKLGAPCVKVFPISAVGHADYLQSLRIPLAGIPLIPTGGVSVNNATSYIRAGAIAVGLAGDLLPATAIADRRWDILTAQATTLVQNLQAASAPNRP
jgi:2-dehydro-3-deoxyphosphogluconate aldolase / (4S)-4-hydroxy-2-oxoglutarate aldolase